MSCRNESRGSADSSEFGFRPLDDWLSRSSVLPKFFDIEHAAPDLEHGLFLGLCDVVEAHEVEDYPAQDLATSWGENRAYIKRALALIEADEPVWLDRDDVDIIRAGLGEPPKACCPLYVISIGEGSEERAVYVGRTSSPNGRFAGGHAALARLHAPKFGPLRKRVYFGSVMLLTDSYAGNKGYLPLEWVHPLPAAKVLLSDVEKLLVYDLQPSLNRALRKRYSAKNSIGSIHVQNFTPSSTFLKDYFSAPQF